MVLRHFPLVAYRAPPCRVSSCRSKAPPVGLAVFGWLCGFGWHWSGFGFRLLFLRISVGFGLTLSLAWLWIDFGWIWLLAFIY